MIHVNKSEQFPLSVALLDTDGSQLISGKTIYYDVRDAADNALSTPINGAFTESILEQGIYKAVTSIPDEGVYYVYITCSGYISHTEEVFVNEKNIYDISEANRHYNISVEDVIRTTADGSQTPSQLARKVPSGKTDYVVTKIKADTASDWSSPVASGIVYAHYKTTSDVAPYKMGGPF